MSLKNLLQSVSKDTVTLVKQDGSRTDGIPAVVEPHEITVFDDSLDVDEGDKIERRLPTGRLEVYQIRDVGYNAGRGPVEAFYKMRVKKESAIEDAHQSQAVVFNVTGHGSRVNINSSDSSTNITTVGADELFERMRETTKSLEADQRELLVKRIDAMERSVGTSSFAESYRDFISTTADHISLFAPFMPALAQLLA